ncbi:50S ribosomal protein L33 [Bacillus sp. J33]|nr:50S ribosomal protein L33 [Bacillus sp. J33]
MTKKVILACSACGSRNYSSASKNDSKRLELKKFCSTCSTHTIHKETK